MGIHSREHDYARYGDGTGRHDDQRKPAARLCGGAGRAACLILALCWAGFASAEALRIATYDIEMSRRGPGVLLRDLMRGDDQARAVAQVVAHVAPDVLVVQGLDYDADLLALTALRDVMAEAGEWYEHVFALPPNTGVPTGLDLDGDGRLGGPADAQGYGRFRGADGMAVLSRWPVVTGSVRDFSEVLWRDVPGAVLPEVDGAPFPSAEAQALQRLSSVGHWVVPVAHPEGVVTVMTFAAGPPVFDGPEDRNGLRNADEIRFWKVFWDGGVGPPPDRRFVIAGNANLDPRAGEGRREVIADLINDPRLQDPLREAGPTVDWAEPKPGDLRVSYVLPSADWTVEGGGVFWPREGSQGHELLSFGDVAASRHKLVWVDISF